MRGVWALLVCVGACGHGARGVQWGGGDEEVKGSSAQGGLRWAERVLTDEQHVRCKAEVDALQALGVSYTLATVAASWRHDDDFLLAVYNVSGGAQDIVSAALLDRGHWEGTEALDAFHWATGVVVLRGPANMRGRRVAVDIGANVGYYTFLGAKLGWEVLAVEGMPWNYALLRLSKCLNPKLAKNITLRRALLGKPGDACVIASDSTNIGDTQMFCDINNAASPAAADDDADDDDGPGGRVVDLTSPRKTPGQHEWGPRDVARFKAEQQLKSGRRYTYVEYQKVEALDDVLDEVYAGSGGGAPPPLIGFMKIDVEGSEYVVLASARRWLARGSILALYSEVWDSVRGGPVEFMQYLAGLGFSLTTHPCHGGRFLSGPADFKRYTHARPGHYDPVHAALGQPTHITMFCGVWEGGVYGSERTLAPWQAVLVGVFAAVALGAWRGRQWRRRLDRED